MPPRFDADALTLELAVADLVEPTLARTIGFAHRGGYERLWLGQAIHGRYQEEALANDPTYRREVTLRTELAHRGWTVILRGRLDGLRREADGTRVVEEIKSVRREGQLAPALREIYERQAAALRLDARARRRRAGARRAGADRHRLATPSSASSSSRSISRRSSSRSGGASTACCASTRRRGAQPPSAGAPANELAFPHGELRPGQEVIVAAVEEALAGRSHLLVEAPTGIGKTAAALFPALRHALTHGKRLFVLTAKNLQQEMATRVLRLLAVEGGFHALRLRAKARMCANGEVICHEEYCPFARDYYEQARDQGRRPPAPRRGERARAGSSLLRRGAGRGLPLRGEPRPRRGARRSWSATTTTPSTPTCALADFAPDARPGDTSW
jgi:DNA excision repair protein ERCC-2